MTQSGTHGRATGASSGQLLSLIRTRPQWTRRQLLDVTGMSRPTLLERMTPLFNAGLLREPGVSAPRGGRPARLIQFDDGNLVVLTFDIGHTHGRVSYTRVDGREVSAAACRLDISGSRPADVLDMLVSLAMEIQPASGGERLIGIGVGVPGPVSPVTGLPGPIPIMPGWDTYPLTDRLGGHWPVPVVCENDARALALGEATTHAGTVLAVKWANGIGAGLVTGGCSLTGDDGAAGDIGHIRLTGAGPRCRCGRHGCLAAHASGHALLGRLRRHGVTTLERLAELSRDGDPVVARALDDAARKLGTVLASLIALTNPRHLVLGGTIGSLPAVVDAVAGTVRETALQRSTEFLEIGPSRLGSQAATIGLCRLVIDRVLAPDEVDRSLSAVDMAFGVRLG